MLIRHLPLILVASAIAPVLAPLGAAAQPTLGPGIRTEMTPVDREAHNGVFDRKPKSSAADAGLKPTVSVGDVQPVTELKAEDVARQVAESDVTPAGEPEGYVTRAHPYTTDPPPKTVPSKGARPKGQGAPVDHESQNKALPPGADAREVRPAQAFPPDRIEKAEP